VSVALPFAKLETATPTAPRQSPILHAVASALHPARHVPIQEDDSADLSTPDQEGKMQSALYDAAGHRRSPVTMPGFHEGRAPRNKGRRYPADPPTVEEIIAVMRAAGTGADGARLRALIVILWRAGLRIGEALGLAETDLDASRGAVLIRRGKGGRAATVRAPSTPSRACRRDGA
jgi:integrase